jgi:hypothetical protein
MVKRGQMWSNMVNHSQDDQMWSTIVNMVNNSQNDQMWSSIVNMVNMINNCQS